MKRTPLVTNLCISLLIALGACGDDTTGYDITGDDTTDDGPTDDRPRFELTFTGDASFQGAHAGQVITLALIRTSDGAPFPESSGPISDAPATISFRFGSIVEFGETYEIHYWIDSNFGGGTEGVCDPPAIDHQWNVAVPAVAGDVNILEPHNGATVTDVCSTFPP